eukprot:750128-Hanusia_phi.AAC.5
MAKKEGKDFLSLTNILYYDFQCDMLACIPHFTLAPPALKFRPWTSSRAWWTPPPLPSLLSCSPLLSVSVLQSHTVSFPRLSLHIAASRCHLSVSRHYARGRHDRIFQSTGQLGPPNFGTSELSLSSELPSSDSELEVQRFESKLPNFRTSRAEL